MKYSGVSESYKLQWFISGWRDMSSGRDLTERTNSTFCRHGSRELTAHPVIIIRLEVRLLITISHYLGRSANKQTNLNYPPPPLNPGNFWGLRSVYDPANPPVVFIKMIKVGADIARNSASAWGLLRPCQFSDSGVSKY